VVPRGELTDAQWVLIQPLLPPQRTRTGRPALDHRLIVNAILWLTRIGAPLRDLPEPYGSGKTIYSGLQRWHEQGIWERIFAALLGVLSQQKRDKKLSVSPVTSMALEDQ